MKFNVNRRKLFRLAHKVHIVPPSKAIFCDFTTCLEWFDGGNRYMFGLGLADGIPIVSLWYSPLDEARCFLLQRSKVSKSVLKSCGILR